MAVIEADDLRRRIAARRWYHTIALGSGLETAGYFDLRAVAPKVLPASLAGKRCLDVATFDGFWALEMARRGAGEVVAIDVVDPRRWDWPVGTEAEVMEVVSDRAAAGDGFDLVMEATGEAIERREMSVYELDPEKVGEFDFVYVGSLLLHLRDPVRAIERVRSVCAGQALFVDAIDPVLTRLHPRRPLAALDGRARPWWWKPNVAGLERMVHSGGFEVTGTRRVTMKPGAGYPRPRVKLRALRSQEVRSQLRSMVLGDPHVAIDARPRFR